MSRKFFAQASVLTLLLLAFLIIPPPGAQAGGVCGGRYIVDAGDTLKSIAAKCGTSVSAITSANSGVADPLHAGQALTVPSSSGGSGVTVSIVSSGGTTTSYSPTPAPVRYSNGTYIIQYGDTFSAIASRYGLSVNQLWAANQQIWNINYVYVGQVIYIPTAGGQTTYVPVPGSSPLSYGNVPDGTPYSKVRLVNKSSSKDIYVSLQGTTRDGVSAINEYWVSGSLSVKIPSGSYKYVAWANEREFVGYFQLGKDSNRTLTFFNSKSTAE